jgi:cytochrome c oxidase subunit I+III
MLSEVIATCSRRPVFGYIEMVLSMAATAFIGFGVWVHHMFTTGLPQVGQSLFTASPSDPTAAPCMQPVRP